MTRHNNEIPGIELMTPTIYSAKFAAREYIQGRDHRSPITLLRDLAMAYVTLPGANTTEETQIRAFGRERPRLNPWRNDFMRVREVREVAFETENGPAGIKLSEQSDAYRRRFKPAIRILGDFAFSQAQGHNGSLFETLTLSRHAADGEIRHTQLLLDPWVEIDNSAAFTDWVYSPFMEEMLEFPDEPTVIAPYPKELRKD